MKRRTLLNAALLGLLLIIINPGISEAKPKLVSSNRISQKEDVLLL